jgi:Apc13p protein
MDMEFCAPVHLDGALVIEIIDNEWATDTLPMDDIEVPASAIAPLDDDDIIGAPPVDDASAPENRWTDLGLDAFANAGE